MCRVFRQHGVTFTCVSSLTDPISFTCVSSLTDPISVRVAVNPPLIEGFIVIVRKPILLGEEDGID